MAKSTFGILVAWADVAFGWMKKGVRRVEVDKIDRAVSGHRDADVDRILRGVEAKRKRRTDSA